MSVKRIIVALIALILVGGFIWLGATSLIKAQDEKLRYEQKLQDKTLNIEKLETREEKLKQEQIKAEEYKALQEKQLQESQQKQAELLQKQKELEAQLQAKLDTKNKIALASAKKTGTDSSSVPVIGSDELTALITNAANKYGVSIAMMVRLAKCESTYGANLRNPLPVVIKGVSYGHAEGIFQFLPSTWTRMSTQAGFGGSSVYDAYANVNVAAWAFANGAKDEWECK